MTKMSVKHEQSAIVAMYAGVALTVVTLIVPYIDHATGNVLADHIRAGYPRYGQARIDTAVTTYLVYVSILERWACRNRPRSPPPARSRRAQVATCPGYCSGDSSWLSVLARAPKMRRSSSAMRTSLMLASRRVMRPCSSNSQSSLP
jgi:hypothetical protein